MQPRGRPALWNALWVGAKHRFRPDTPLLPVHERQARCGFRFKNGVQFLCRKTHHSEGYEVRSAWR